MRLARSHWVKAACRFDNRGDQTIDLQQVGQREQTEAGAGFLQKVAAVGEFLITSAVMAHSDVLTASGLSDNCLVLSSPGWSLIVAEDFKQPVRPGDLRSTHLGMTSETAMYERGVDLPRKKWVHDSLETEGHSAIENEIARLV